MRSSPFPSLSITLRVLAKAVILLLILNFVCLAVRFNPVATLTRFNTWWLVGHGRARLVYPSDFQNGQLPVEDILGAHEIAYTPKTDDEYRVILLGESGIAGWGLHDQDTLSAQLTARNIRINGKRLVAYNLAYPSPSAARDVLILDGALRYRPDLVLWFITPAALDNSVGAVDTNGVFFDLNREQLKRITSANNLIDWYTTRFPTEPPNNLPFVAIQGQDTLPVWLNSLFYPFIVPDLGLTTRRVGSEPLPEIPQYTIGRAGFDPMPNETWRFLDIGRTLAEQAGARLMLINEPMLIGSGLHSDVIYNREYQRAFYDAYRQKLIDYAAQNKFRLVDLWNVIPAASFTDTPLHSDPAGYAVLTDHLVKLLEE
jgi:hypothetical protein